jgi:hypothetical protein
LGKSKPHPDMRVKIEEVTKRLKDNHNPI